MMGFFCYTCGRKVRGQPIKHKCTRKGGMRLQQSIYANKRTVKEYNQKRSQGKNPPKPKCMRKQKNRRTKTGSSSTKGDFSKNKKTSVILANEMDMNLMSASHVGVSREMKIVSVTLANERDVYFALS